MKRRKIIWFLYPTYLLIILLCLAPIALLMARIDRKIYFQETAKYLKHEARLVERMIDPLLSAEPETLAARCQELSRLIAARITIVLPDGRVLIDTQEDPGQMENHAGRPEIEAALNGHDLIIQRHSFTLHEDMIYLAIPHFQNRQIQSVIRLSIPVASFIKILKRIYLELAFYGSGVALIAILISWFLSRWLSRPLEELQTCTRAYAAGDFTCKLPNIRAKEINSLAENFQDMGRKLNDYLQATIRQKSEQEAILASMQEGVLAVDANECIATLNQGAATLFGFNVDKGKGMNFRAVIRHPEMQQMISSSLEANAPLQAELLLLTPRGEKTVMVNGMPWINEKGEGMGAILVLNDISRLKALERVRRDFVANVSHELKTPITLIQGFVETLLEHALTDPQESRKFLNTILEHARRLNDIIEDLLNLSKIEQLEETELIKEELFARDLLEAVVQDFTHQAKEKNIRLEHTCPPDLKLHANLNLLERALANLIDNAVKYSPEAGNVKVEAERVGPEIRIRVADKGPGIAAEHLPRLFERFYRVEQDRNRRSGGTGLGLAIVKHIAQVHKGRVSVESKLGQGSTFTLHLPAVD